MSFFTYRQQFMISPHICFTLYQLISPHIACHSRQIILCQQRSGATRANRLELVRLILITTNAASKVTEIVEMSIHMNSISPYVRKGFWACLSDLYQLCSVFVAVTQTRYFLRISDEISYA